MPFDDPNVSVTELREGLRSLSKPFLLRTYEATAEDYEEITDEDLKCEFVDGELIVHSPASFNHESLTSFLNALLVMHVGEKRLGTVLGSNAVMQLGERRFSPDISVLKNENSARIKGPRVVGPMDLAVEVLSTSTRQYDRTVKLPAYRDAKVAEIWLVDRDRRQFEAHAMVGSDYTTQSLTTGRWSSVTLPGFALDVDWLWMDPLPSVLACRDRA